MKALRSEAAIPITSLLKATAEALAAAGIAACEFEAKVLLAHVLDTSPGRLAAADHEVSPLDARSLNHLVALRSRHMPLNYVLRSAEFMGLRFRSEARALSPRPETELLAEIVIERMHQGGSVSGLLVDVGCGCGVLGLSVIHQFPNLTLLGSDIAVAALQLYAENAGLLGLAERAHAIAGSYLDWLGAEGAQAVRYLLSNPPYVRPAD